MLEEGSTKPWAGKNPWVSPDNQDVTLLEGIDTQSTEGTAKLERQRSQDFLHFFTLICSAAVRLLFSGNFLPGDHPSSLTFGLTTTAARYSLSSLV